MTEKENNMQSKQSQMRKGMLGYAVLLCIENEESYSSHILGQLKKADLIVVEGTLYPLLSRFKREWLLEYNWQESKNGPPRKYYSLTQEGKNTLTILHETWSGLMNSINTLKK